MLGGVFGSFGADIAFYFLYNYDYVSGFFYTQHIIALEMISGALIMCYLLGKLGKKKEIELE